MNINNLDECIVNCVKSHYQYKNVHFLVDLRQNAKKLVVLFHGGRCGAKLPIFRGYNYVHNDIVFLSISDPLLEKYENVEVTWYSDSYKYKFSDTIEEIINYCKSVSNSLELLLVGQCSGAYAALKYSLKYNCDLLITNPQLCIHTGIKSIECDNNTNHKNRLIDELKKNHDELDLDILDINKITNNMCLKKLMCYGHIDDYTFLSLGYLKYLIEHNILKTDNNKFFFQTYETDNPHAAYFPKNIKLNYQEAVLHNIIVNYDYYLNT